MTAATLCVTPYPQDQTMNEPSNENELSPLYVLRVHGEERAAHQLEVVGITSWAPMYKRLRPKVGRRAARLVDSPLIPGYVFARLGDRDFAAAMATERVWGVISENGFPRQFPEAEFTKVLRMALSGAFDDRLPSTQTRPRGERKRGLAGLHAWFEAVGAGEVSQLQSKQKNAKHRFGGEPVSEGASSSRRSTKGRRRAKGHRIRKMRSVA